MGDPPFAFLDLAGHVIEAGGKAGEFVMPFDGDLAAVAFGQALGGLVEPGKRGGDPRGGVRAGPQEQREAEQGEAEDRVLNRAVGAHRRLARVEQEQRGGGLGIEAGQGAGDGESRMAPDREGWLAGLKRGGDGGGVLAAEAFEPAGHLAPVAGAVLRDDAGDDRHG